LLGRLFLAAFPADLGHVFAVAANLFATFAADLSHVFSIPAYGHSALAGRFRTGASTAIIGVVALHWHSYLHLLVIFTGYFLTVFLKLNVRRSNVCQTPYISGNFLLLMVSFITLALFYFGFRVLADVAAERTADVVAFLELALFIPPDKSFVATGIDEFSFASRLFRCHFTPP
jgi:hypothetical protein